MKLTATQYSAIGIVAAFIAIGSALSVVFLGHSSKNDPADILPAKETVVLMRHADQATVQLLAKHVSGFDGVPLPGHPVDIALLKLPDGKTSWVMLDTEAAPAGMRFSITASDTAAQGLIGKGTARLADEPAYMDLRGFLSEDEPGAYLRFPDMTWKAGAPAASHLSPHAPVAVIFGQADTRFILPSSEASIASWALNQVPVFDDASIRIAVDDLRIVPYLTDVLSPVTDTLLQSSMRTRLARMFGANVSPAFDLAPLLRTSFSLQADTAAGTKILAAGQAENGQAARETLTKLHEAFAANIPGIEIVSRPLDDQFSYTGIRQTDDTVTHTTERVNGYDVEKSIHKAGTGAFVSAIRGSSVLLSNDESVLRRAITSTPVPVTDGSIASIHAARTDLSNAWKTFLPLTDSVLEAGTAPVEWTVKQDGNRLILNIRR